MVDCLIEDIILGSTKFGEEIQNAYVRRFGINTVDKNWVWKHSNADNIKKYLGNNTAIPAFIISILAFLSWFIFQNNITENILKNNLGISSLISKNSISPNLFLSDV